MTESKYHKCQLCGAITDNFKDAIDHTLKHVTVERSYSVPYFYACPVCDRCFNTSNEMDECINKHLIILDGLGYVKAFTANRRGANTTTAGQTAERRQL